MDIRTKILRSVVDHYIQCGTPIGSAQLKDEFEIGVSSATIRNYLKELAELGKLEKLHTSSGRIPTKSALKSFWQGELQKVSTKIKDEDELERLSSKYGLFSVILEQKQDVLQTVESIEDRYILLYFKKGAVSIRYGKAMLKFFSQLIGYSAYELANISVSMGLLEASNEIKDYIIKFYAKKFNKLVLIELAINDREWAKEYFELFNQLYIVFEAKVGVSFVPIIPKNSMLVKTQCELEDKKCDMIVVGGLEKNFKAFFKEF